MARIINRSTLRIDTSMPHECEFTTYGTVEVTLFGSTIEVPCEYVECSGLICIDDVNGLTIESYEDEEECTDVVV